MAIAYSVSIFYWDACHQYIVNISTSPHSDMMLAADMSVGRTQMGYHYGHPLLACWPFCSCAYASWKDLFVGTS